MTTVRRTRRWRGVIAVALLAGAAGLLFKRPDVLLCSVIGVVYAAYPRATSTPAVSLDLDRRVDDGGPVDGEDVAVTVTVRNTGSSTLADLRLVDGVPPMLTVSEGTPRHAATLRPGEETTFNYGVRAKQGTHRFDPATVVVRDVSGATEVETEVADETTIECVADVPELPLREQTTRQTGRIVASEGGSGVEFHRTREYQRGDDVSRIDWRRFARTGELATTEFRVERAASVVVCLDVGPSAYRSAEAGEPHAVAYERAAAEQLVEALSGTRDAVGLATVGATEDAWLAPGTGQDHSLRARRLLASHSALSLYPPEDDDGVDYAASVRRLRRRLDATTQVVLVSPLLETGVVSTALELEAEGNVTTVLSPQVTTESTVGGRLAATERANRASALREAGVRVVDWDPTVPLGTALVEAERRWSR